jgi:hypothetical protein
MRYMHNVQIHNEQCRYRTECRHRPTKPIACLLAAKHQSTLLNHLKDLTGANTKLLKEYRRQKTNIIQISKQYHRPPPVQALPVKQTPRYTPAVAMARSAGKLAEVEAPLVAIRERLQYLRRHQTTPDLTGILTYDQQQYMVMCSKI